jgi:L-alanine-DL-glutamate epimerase-like enolase superfamily enzyme
MTGFTPFRVTASRVFPLRLDFRMDVAHGLASRAFSDNVFVEFISDSGLSGYGECVPRSYVTGETPEGALAAIPAIAAGFEGRMFCSPAELAAALEEEGVSDTGTANPAAFCAVELALLDLAGRHWNIPATAVIGLDMSRDPPVYSLVAPLMSDEALAGFLGYTADFRFGHVKVKVDGDDPAARVRLVKSLVPPDMEIRVDANCSWRLSDAPAFVRDLAAEGVVSVEQPLSAADLDGMADLRGRGVLITLDESVRNPGDVERAADAGACDIVNVRISKCGGLSGALRVIRAAEHRGLGVQLGAQVGESCILSAAGALLAAGIPSFRWLEGAFGTHLLVRDLCGEPFQFGIRGELSLPGGPGLGVGIAGDPANGF